MTAGAGAAGGSLALLAGVCTTSKGGAMDIAAGPAEAAGGGIRVARGAGSGTVTIEVRQAQRHRPTVGSWL